MSDLPQLVTGGIIGVLATWFGGLLKPWFEHILEQRKERAKEERTIRAEEREVARKQTELKQAEAAQRKKDEAVLLMYKTQLRGATELLTAADIVVGIHSFFIQRPHYLNATNRAFLEKYPGDFRDRVHFDADALGPRASTLAELKHNVETLHLGLD